MVNIKIEGVNFSYKSVKALENVTVEVESGSFTALLGPNGSGKTTLLKCLSGVLKPNLGTIYFNEKDLANLSGIELAKIFSAVFTTPIETPQMGVADIIATARHPWIGWLGFLSLKDIDIINDAAEKLEIKDLVSRRFNELSDGQKQKVLIARALAQEAEVMLLDEPVAHLDVKHQIEVLNLIKKITKEKNLITVSTLHDVNLAAFFCDSIILLNKGKVVSVGSVDSVLTSENIEKVFNIKVIVKKHPITGSPYIMPVCSPEFKAVQPKNITAHIVCGGGTGASLMRILLEHGYKVTAGVLNVLDSDYEEARTLGVDVVTEAPFSPITNESYKANLEKMNKANLIILTNVPFGYGNFKNLEACVTALKKGIPVIVVEETDIKERDFTEGEAQTLYNELRRGSAIFAKNYDQILHIIEEIYKNKTNF
jgi:iron complex transport system ATP-binding protein